MRLARSILSCVVFLLVVPRVQAQQTTPFDLSISPSVVEVALQPGKLVTQAFLIENAGEIDLEITPVLRDFTSDNRSGSPVLLDSSSFPYASLQNAKVALNQPFPLLKNSSEQLVLALDVPPEADERDWYVSLVLNAQPLQETQLTTSGSEVTGRIGANLLIRVTQTNQVPLSWTAELQGVPRWTDSLQSLHIRPFVSNTSSTVAAPDFTLLVLDGRGNIVYEHDGLPDRVLAKSTREILAAKQRKDDPRSSEGASFIFDPLFAFGPYTVRATIRNAATGPVVVEQSYFAFPFSLCLAIIFFALLLALVRRWKLRH